ncbi:MAG: PAS domain S-box protein, partial [Gammaproteobacteria bacterium]|nr:PAS domain S-box protein [Gammaproteobacteria bacterium]
MRPSNFLSLRGRFLVAPVLGVILTLILYFTSNAIIQSQSKIFKQLSDSNLPQVSQISQVTILLVNNHTDLSTLLRSAAADPDEERIYLQGRTILNKLHELEELLNLSLRSSKKIFINQTDILDKLKLSFSKYREVTINAIELSTVDPRLAQKELITLEKVRHQLNSLFLVLSKYHVNNLTEQSSLVESSLYNENIISVLAIVLLLIMVVSALYFSSHLSSGLEQVNTALIKLSEDDSDIILPEQNDKYLHQLITAVYKFKQTLDKNEEHQESLKRSIEWLKDSEERYFNLIDLVPTAIVIINDQQNIILFNRAAETIFGYSSQEVIGQPVELLLPESYRHKHRIDVDNFRTSDKQYSPRMDRKPVTALRKNREKLFIEVNLGKLELANETL